MERLRIQPAASSPVLRGVSAPSPAEPAPAPESDLTIPELRAAIEQHPARASLGRAGKQRLREILSGAAGPRELYYLQRLKLLLDTPDAPSTDSRVRSLEIMRKSHAK